MLPFLAWVWFGAMNAFLNFTFYEAKLTMVMRVSSISFSNFGLPPRLSRIVPNNSIALSLCDYTFLVA